MTNETFDVLIIGSGHSGGMAAKILTESGIRCLMLNAGPVADVGRDAVRKPASKLPYRGFKPPGIGAPFGCKLLERIASADQAKVNDDEIRGNVRPPTEQERSVLLCRPHFEVRKISQFDLRSPSGRRARIDWTSCRSGV